MTEAAAKQTKGFLFRVRHLDALAWISAIATTLAALLLLRTWLTATWPHTHEQLCYPGRLEALAGAVSLATPYPRWITELAGNNGYPLFSFYNPLVIYLGLPFRLLGLSSFVSLKIAVSGVVALSATRTVALGDRLFGRGAGCGMACAYLLSPYLVTNLYARGDLAELVAMLLFPVVFDRLVALLRTGRPRELLLLAASYGALLPTHAFSSVLFTIGFTPIVLCLLLEDRALHQRFSRGVLAVAALGLGAFSVTFYWLPVVFETSTVQIDQLFRLYTDGIPEWYEAFLVPTSREPFVRTLTLGLIAYFAVATLALSALSARIRPLHVVLALVTAGALFMATHDALPLYIGSKTLSKLQFPWRFFGLASFGAATLTGALVPLVSRFSRRPALVTATLAVTLLAVGAPIVASAEEERVRETSLDLALRNRHEVLVFDAGEYFPKRVARPNLRPTEPGAFEASAGCLAEATATRPLERRFRVRSPDGCTVVVHQLAWIGWQARVDDQPIAVSVDPMGRIACWVAPGEHDLVVELGGSRAQHAALVVTYVALAALFVLAASLWAVRRYGTAR